MVDIKNVIKDIYDLNFKYLSFQDLISILEEEKEQFVISYLNFISKKIEQINEIGQLSNIDLFFNTLNDLLFYMGNSTISILKKKLSKLNEKIDRKENENKLENKELKKLEYIKSLVAKLYTKVKKDNMNQYMYIETVIKQIKNIDYLKYTFDLIPNIVNIRDNNKTPLIQNVLNNYLNSIKESNEKDIDYYKNIIKLILEDKKFFLKEKDKQRLFEYIYSEIQHLGTKKKVQKQNKDYIKYLQEVIHIIKEDKNKFSEKTVNINIPVEFSDDILKTVKYYHPKISKMNDREIINDYTVTIDTAKTIEMDDALSCKKLANGNYLLGVHIVSVLGYFPYESKIIQEALNRTKTIYLKEPWVINGENIKKIPLFPYEFSANIASLIPNQKKLTGSFLFEIDSYGNIIDEKFIKSITMSNKQLTFQEADLVLNSKEHNNLVNTLHNLEEVAKLFINKNHVRGTDEVISSQRMVEQIMTLVGKRVASKLTENHKPCICRVVDNKEEILRKIGILEKKYFPLFIPKKFEELKENLAVSTLKVFDEKYPDLNARVTSPLRNGVDILNHFAAFSLLGDEEGIDAKILKKDMQYFVELYNQKEKELNLLDINVKQKKYG